MVIVKILGGFGNQLSAYSWGYALSKHLGQELVLDVSDYTHKGYARPYCLDQLNIGRHRKLVYPPYSKEFMDESDFPPSLRKNLRVIKDETAKNREELLKAAQGAENVYLLGYGGIHFCTPEEQAELREQFRLKKDSLALNVFLERIRNQRSFAVHVRRTDFVGFGAQTPDVFFDAAIAYVRLFYPDAQFYFFSDDIAYTKRRFGRGGDYHYVHFLGGIDADLDEFFCMSACDGRILSKNSTFSEWASALNRSENKLDIYYGAKEEHPFHGSKVYLSDHAVEILKSCRRENAEGTANENIPTDVRPAVAELLEKEENDKAIRLIDSECMDVSGTDEAILRDLDMFKAIAYAQKGSEGLNRALRSFYRQMQTERENGTFHANYFIALYQSGRWLESAIHAAMANRCGDTEDYGARFTGGEEMREARELYLFLRDLEPMQFIFAPIEGWTYYCTYVKTLAVLLSRMGQRVWLVQREEASNQKAEDAVETAIRSALSVDAVYYFGIKSVNPPIVKGRLLYQELFDSLAERIRQKTALIVSNPFAVSERHGNAMPCMVPDVCDPLNREIFYIQGRAEDYAVYMQEHTERMFLNDGAIGQMKRLDRDKLTQAIPAWNAGEYEILDEELDCTENYICSEAMIRNAAKILSAAVSWYKKKG